MFHDVQREQTPDARLREASDIQHVVLLVLTGPNPRHLVRPWISQGVRRNTQLICVIHGSGISGDMEKVAQCYDRADERQEQRYFNADASWIPLEP